ncbi:hypothetical protein B0H17DRAFT_1144279 [Mycena rosella]|uniref:Uncharacterized protein n=1 Tax=Mycena rosella TaxID=1033263 RepID=A0AAD7CTU5_MYCRO|nr:hypothetical protein B0H17DRAFT_1144279 [Mycena rosella]
MPRVKIHHFAETKISQKGQVTAKKSLNVRVPVLKLWSRGFILVRKLNDKPRGRPKRSITEMESNFSGRAKPDMPTDRGPANVGRYIAFHIQIWGNYLRKICRWRTKRLLMNSASARGRVSGPSTPSTSKKLKDQELLTPQNLAVENGAFNFRNDVRGREPIYKIRPTPTFLV